MRVKISAVLTAAALVTAPVAASAAVVIGSATVIDGDTVEISGQRIRLFGIDAPELSQTCDRTGEKWECGKAASDHLRSMIGGASLACHGTEKDAFDRLVAVCTVAGVELNRAIVAEGWATAFRRYSDAYLADEARAQAGKRGIWASSFIRPEEYRTALSTRPEVEAPKSRITVARRAASSGGGCFIKGNHSPRGDWIYHLPGMPYYEQTRAEAVFCSEAQAQAAGYRRSRAR